ncbi:hypothetical protein D3K81_07955 [Salmonella enterica]|nr:hypothetical protein [Salmonella enterica]EAQ9179330.1 hypothetical protein [Salmonella enterica]EAS0410759.1 hypothetical protein [Salmonella enterica]EBL2567235.1 hypothetical protein [Salmonella enterica]EGN6644995.1 hypothetical protein [Salmonella enterica]
MKHIFLLLLAFTFKAGAASTYTKEQLNDMAAAGKYPEQESPVTKSIEAVSFSECKSSTLNVLNQVSGNYPAKEVVNTGVLYVVKIWTNDGVIMVSCSEPDNKKVVTQSSYK